MPWLVQIQFLAELSQFVGCLAMFQASLSLVVQQVVKTDPAVAPNFGVFDPAILQQPDQEWAYWRGLC